MNKYLSSFMRNILFAFLLFLLLGGLLTAWYIFTDAPSEPVHSPCETCSIPLAYDEQGQVIKSDWNKEISPSIKAKVNNAVKDFVDAEASGGIDLSFREGRVTRTFQMTRPADLEKTQNANLYRLVACTFERIYCQDLRLSEEERQEKILEVFREFKKNINDLILEGKASTSNEDTPPGSKKAKENTPKETELSKNDGYEFPSSASPVKRHGTDYLQADNLDMALLAEGPYRDQLTSELTNYLRRSKGISSDPFGLNSQFVADFSSYYQKGNWGFLDDLDFKNRLNCICHAISDLKKTVSEEEGVKFLTVSGTTKITVIHIPSGRSYHAVISTAGSGPLANEKSAEKSYLENMLRSQDFNTLPFNLCH
ncbi:MAG: hypothetical protein H6560_04590 [Lewinellaceae bacterium]|nr:hypothetical protein [Lewinellaceae bacterium]